MWIALVDCVSLASLHYGAKEIDTPSKRCIYFTNPNIMELILWQLNE